MAFSFFADPISVAQKIRASPFPGTQGQHLHAGGRVHRADGGKLGQEDGWGPGYPFTTIVIIRLLPFRQVS